MRSYRKAEVSGKRSVIELSDVLQLSFNVLAEALVDSVLRVW